MVPNGFGGRTGDEDGSVAAEERPSASVVSEPADEPGSREADWVNPLDPDDQPVAVPAEGDGHDGEDASAPEVTTLDGADEANAANRTDEGTAATDAGGQPGSGASPDDSLDDKAEAAPGCLMPSNGLGNFASARRRGDVCPTGSAPLPGQPVVRPNGVVERTTWRASPRRTLRAGDEIKVSGGPYWEGRAEDGTPVRHRMAERGRMVFRAHCELGGSAWVEATSGRGVVVLHVGHEQPSSVVPGLVRRPYRISKARKKSGAKGREAK